jgi:hypothetical protein
VIRAGGGEPKIVPAAEWVVDCGGVLAIDERTGDPYWLRGTEAAVWGWLVAGHPRSEIVTLLAAYQATDPARAERALGAILRSWEDSGLVASRGQARG